MKKIQQTFKFLEKEFTGSSDRYRVFENFLDYCLDFFDVRHYQVKYGFGVNVQNKLAENNNFFKALLSILSDVEGAINSGELLDPLGRIYEEFFQSKMKGSRLGQFFTPESLCQLMSRSVDDTGSEGSVYDCACGSGRTLIAHRLEAIKADKLYPAEYVGEDIDLISVKMCALNLMWYGCRGRVVHCDTLRQEYYGTAYVINEVRYPMFVPFYSVRKVNVRDLPVKEKPTLTQQIQKEKNNQLILQF